MDQEQPLIRYRPCVYAEPDEKARNKDKRDALTPIRRQGIPLGVE